MARSTPRARRVTFWVLLIALSVIASLTAAEIALRAVYRDQDVTGTYWGIGGFEADSVLGYRHAAGYRGRVYRPGVFDCPVEISQYGLRQAGVEVQLRYTRKVLLLGDSFTFGLGVSEDATFASLMQASLNAEGIGVINAAQTGYSAEQEVMLGIRLMPIVSPDLILLCLYLDNDVKEDYTGGYKDVEVRWGCRISKDRRLAIPVVDLLRTHSYVWMFLAQRLHTEKLKEPPEVIAVSHIIRPTLDAVMRLRDHCEDNGIGLGIVMIPPRSGGTVFDIPFKDVLTAEGLAILDLGESMAGGEGYFHIDGHWNHYGHESAAADLIPFARSLIR